jgi:hypothetical protein
MQCSDICAFCIRDIPIAAALVREARPCLAWGITHDVFDVFGVLGFVRFESEFFALVRDLVLVLPDEIGAGQS